MIQTLREKLAEMEKSCCEYESLTYQEKGKGVRLTSVKGQAIKITIDGCLITKGSKCDCLFFYETSNKRYAFLVELKGTDYAHALEQLATTKAHEKYTLLRDSIKPCKEKAVAIVGEKAKTNRPKKEEWEEENGIRLKVVPLERDQTYDLISLV
jgi:hypothetical protein